MRPRPLLLLVLVVLLSRAAAAVEGESSLALSPRYAALSLVRDGKPELSGSGGGLVVDFQRAISDNLWLRAALGGAAYDLGSPTFTGLATGGITYAVDVLKYVPYLGIGAGALVIGGGALDAARVEPYVELGVGIEVLQSTRFSWGVDARFSSFAGHATTFLLGPRFAWRWGYF